MAHYGAIDSSGLAPPRRRSDKKKILALAAAGVCLLAFVAVRETAKSRTQTELLGTWTKPHGIGIDQEPYSAPANLYLYWGSTVNKRFTGSGEHVRHLFKLGSIQGGEYRDPKFLGSLTGGMFNALASKCCTSLLFPPMEWDFPVHNPHQIVGQNLRAYVANGNSMILTGGLIDLEFINSYFFYNLEPADGNYSPGPFRQLPRLMGLSESQSDMMGGAPKSLPQIGISVTAVKKDSLPSGATVLYGTPRDAGVFSIKFCMADNPMNDEATTLPPVKVLPRDCPAAAKEGRPCSCGFICYLGYNWNDRYPSRWDKALKIVQEMCSEQPPENSLPALKAALEEPAAGTPTQSTAAAAAAPQQPQAAATATAPAPVAAPPQAPAAVAPAPAPAAQATMPQQPPAAQAAPQAPAAQARPGPAAGTAAAPRNAAAAKSCGGSLCNEDFSKEEGCGPLCRMQRLIEKLSS